MNIDMLDVYPRAAKRWGWRFAPVSTLLWTVFLPQTIVWLVVSLILRHRRLDKSPEARRERRIARLLCLYPESWRARYGEEFAEILRDTIREGRGGVRLTLNVIRESVAARRATLTRRVVVEMTCWSLCWIPLVPQGFVPLVMKLSGSINRAWFVALYLPASCQWLVIAAMLTIGTAMLVTALRMRGVRLVLVL
jgi:hypothetical protein